MYIPERFNHLYGIPLIMEVGSLNTKIGYAGKDRPDGIAPSVTYWWFSMSRLINRQGRSITLISIRLSVDKIVTLNRSYKIVSSRIGKGSKLWPITISIKKYSLPPKIVLCSTLSPHLAANSIGKNLSNSFFRVMDSMASLCTRRQFYQLIFSVLKAL